MNLDKFIETYYPLKDLLKYVGEDNKLEIIKYYENAKSDANFGYISVKNYLNKSKRILEIGGGLHFLSSYLKYEGYKIQSIECGGFQNYIDKMREYILIKNKSLEIHNQTLEKYAVNSAEKFDFIFSINVLEHVNNIENHLTKSISLLKDKDSRMLIKCPNYSFPFESHFYTFFIPFAPLFTLKKIKKNKLIKKFGEETYNRIIESLNFNCSFTHIQKLNFNIFYINPFSEVMKRIKYDQKFSSRIFSNYFIKVIYLILIKAKLYKIVEKIFPKRFFPYLIMLLKK
ncbi:class I SAM-dependent methyltransferase [Candidatus Pelagibacter sp. HIMB1509]|uniref:class I SAM-dependent methyltransferase n=1 Tax=Candidatus Pelagibacter sp. HIMB1509 TaxID=3413339 RepID=UPI003F8351E8